MDEQLASRVISTVADSLSLPPEAVNLDSCFVDDLNADSLDMIDLMLAAEREFKVRIPVAEGERLGAVRDLFNFIAGSGGK